MAVSPLNSEWNWDFRSLPALFSKLTVFSVCLRVTDGVRALPEGSGQLHPAEGAGLEREGPPPAAIHRCLTFPAVLEWTHHPLGEVLIWHKKKKRSSHCTESDELEFLGGFKWTPSVSLWRDTVSRHLSHEDRCGLLETVVLWTWQKEIWGYWRYELNQPVSNQKEWFLETDSYKLV